MPGAAASDTANTPFPFATSALFLEVLPREAQSLSAIPLSVMSRFLSAVALLFFGLLCFADATAQTRTLDVLRGDARARLAEADPLVTFRTQQVPGGRMDVEEGVLRAAYRLAARVPQGASPEATARAFFALAAPDFGWALEADDLRLAEVQEGRYAHHLVFQQTFFDLRVYNRLVKVNLDRSGQPTMVMSGYAPHLRSLRTFNPRPSLSAAEAKARTEALIEGGAATSAPELIVYPTKTPRLAWRLVAWPRQTVAELEVLIDAHTGALIQVIDQGMHVRRMEDGGWKMEDGEHGASRYESIFHPPSSIFEAPTVEESIEDANPPSRSADGTGFIFDPDPLSTAGQAYGPPFADAADADLPELNAERREVTLRDITQGSDGLYRLEGPFVRIMANTTAGHDRDYTPPAEANAGAFRYSRADDFFEAVMAYYHIDASQRYVQALDIGHATQDGPIPVNPQAYGSEQSEYLPNANVLLFGTGGVDDAEDAAVILHEYGHALLEGSSPGLRATAEGRALHEGWSDYWAASYARSLAESGATKRSDWQEVFRWDSGDGQIWPGRRLDHPGHYPDDLRCDDSASCDIWDEGRLWATSLMEIYSDLGRDVTDRLSLASHAYLSVPVTMADAAEALLQADADLYGGTHTSVLLSRLGTRGFIDASALGPIVEHDPLPSTEQAGGSVPVTVLASGRAAPIDHVTLFYSINGGPFEELALTPETGTSRYTGALPLPAQTSVITYYVEAVDGSTLRTRLPADAPATTFRFTAGPDATPPTISHAPLLNFLRPAWPPEIRASVEDNLAVQAAWVEYTVEGSDGAVQQSGTFALEEIDGTYRAAFPGAFVPATGSTVRYRLLARDTAAAANEAALPTDGTFAFGIVTEGVLQTFDFETAGSDFQAGGVWERGAPAFGVQVAHSGQQVWGTNLDGTYPAAEHRASLDLPPFNLGTLGNAYLVFWHWYDLEHDGTALPQPGTATLWDGANVKASTDGGQTWSVLQPEGGYNGVIEAGFGNPLGGEPGFGGYSYGWRQEILPLPPAADLRLRFDFGADASNEEDARSFAGWYLDDVTVTTLHPTDEAPPTALALPEVERERSAGDATPIPFTLRALDDTGLAEVQVAYEIVTDAGRQAGSTRLAMRPTDLTTFDGALDLAAAPEAGDRIDYRFILRDFAGNETTAPAPGEPPLRIVYRLTERASALEGVRASGLWERAGSLWRVRPGEAAPSSLVLEPFDLPANARTMHFVLDHRLTLGAGLGGNVKVSTDDGATWQLLVSEDGYLVRLDAPGHPMHDETVLSGGSGDLVSTRFDLTAYAGQQIRLRVDFGGGRAVASGETWEIHQAGYAFSTEDDEFATDRALKLHPNFPDPFAGATTISYTLPEAQPVTLEVYDVLGRRVALLVESEQGAGTHTLSFDAAGLAGGVYLLHFRAGGQQQVERMVVLR